MENEFTVFIVRLPLGQHHLKPEEIDRSQANVMSDVFKKTAIPKIKDEPTKNDEDLISGRKIVLVIEDSEDMRTLIRFGLLDDYKIIEAQDGEEGEKMAIETCPDLIICDVSMPKKEGFEVAANLKKNEITSHIPIILLTGRASQSDIITGLETGVDAYLTKPFHTKELKIRVNKLMEQREKLKEK
ncbi:MAG: response regulator [Bacteroidales bacterium]